MSGRRAGERKRLRAARHRECQTVPWSLRSVPAACNTPAGFIAIEQGRYSPALETAFQIARVCGVGLDQVLQSPDGKGEP